MNKEVIEILELFVKEKTFYTRGLPFAKKMWRDGYNKALEDFLNFMKMKLQEDKNNEL